MTTSNATEQQEKFSQEIIDLMEKYNIKEHPFIKYMSIRNFDIKREYQTLKQGLKEKKEKQIYDKAVECLATKYFLSENRIAAILCTKRDGIN